MSVEFWSGYSGDVFRILHSKAFSRYSDKTQVVYLFEHDHITHRGLHVQLVSNFARRIARKIGCDIDLVEAISLGHDLGHSPFGHEGEKYLSAISVREGVGAFAHARQSCRMAALIEPMSLHFETLDGFLCHDGGMRSRNVLIQSDKTVEDHLAELDLRKRDPEVDLAPKTVEGALVKISDTVSYLVRDIVDALRLRVLSVADIPKTILGISSGEMLEKIGNDIVDRYREDGVVGVSLPVFEAMKQLRAFNFQNIYLLARFKMESQKIERMFDLLYQDLLGDWKLRGKSGSILWDHFLHSKSEAYLLQTSDAERLIDYIAGMTDGYFLRLFRDRFVPNEIEVPHVLPFS